MTLLSGKDVPKVVAVEMENSLRDMLKHGRKFERMRTSIPGVFVRKIPKSRDGPAHLAVEINPVDESGYPVQKIGVVVRGRKGLDAIRAVLSQERLDEVLEVVEGIQPE
ncbi:hypothetical protein EU545_02530 [Candidatus Thorarchaeota archaeon]|nr:MAG: hypothetical protein EU545_02530 [Candidatus Thorarchaeota archaeon]